MPKLSVNRFDGVIPRTAATALGENQAQVANNAKLYSMELRSWRGPRLEFTPAISGVKSIYKYYYTSTSYYWLTWTGDVNVVPSPALQSGDYRVYYTGDGVPKKTCLSLVASGSGAYPQAWLKMGVPNPVAAPTVAEVGSGTTGPDSRVYIYTYISTFGNVQEESGPSAASNIVTTHTGNSVLVTFTDTVPTTNLNITARRLYRSVTGNTTTTYQFVADVPVGTGTYSDVLTAAQLGATISTIGWLPPPDTLSGLLAHPSGSLVGFSGNTIYMSDTVGSHAFPLAYQLNVPYNIVGLGLWGTSIVVMTDTLPYMISGQNPGAMTLQVVQLPEPCVSKRSIATDANGVIYASPNGLVGIGPNIEGVFTEQVFRRQDWQALVPANIFGVLVDNKYIGVYPATAGQNTLVLDRDDVPKCSFLNVAADAVHVDAKFAELYYVDSNDGHIYQLDSDDLNPLAYSWTSKRFVFGSNVSWSAVKVDADYSEITDSATYAAALAAAIAANQAIYAANPNLLGCLNDTPPNTFVVDGSLMNPLPQQNTIRTLQLFVYADKALVQTITLTSFDPVRITPFRCREFEFKLAGTVNVRSVVFATTTAELRG